ncbi:MAG TPA: UDP-N-acetylglucosamine 2-epimerase [Rhizomicrobium sp.]|nr:UDP-N-acetylglucosamine 2-epimerase [Rhizomicrobium sp.]
MTDRNAGAKRRIAVVLIDRANYGRLKPVMQAIKDHPGLELQVVCGGTMVLNRFDRPVRIVEKDGFRVDAEIHLELEGSTPLTMAKSLGFGVIEFTSEFARLKPDMVLVIGDRYEGLAAALAASYMNICLAHAQGGEVSGSIDESARHCMTKLAHYHFPATARSAEYIVRMGELPETVFNVGCPSSDIAHSIDRTLPPDIFADGVGGEVDLSKPYCLVVFHPVTTKFEQEGDETMEVLEACEALGQQVVWLWPNIDAGSDKVSAAIRRFREQRHPQWLRLMKNFPPDDYLRVLANAACALGNSSSFVRDSGFLGTPVVLIGDRQDGREFAHNVMPVASVKNEIVRAARSQLAHGRYSPADLYGDGKVSARIADRVATVPLFVQKRLGYTRP